MQTFRVSNVHFGCLVQAFYQVFCRLALMYTLPGVTPRGLGTLATCQECACTFRTFQTLEEGGSYRMFQHCHSGEALVKFP